MNSRTQERVERWDSRQFEGGYDGLADLAAADFSGAVVASGTWLFLLNGRVVGVVDGTMADFETATGTVYEAPHPSLPLLSAMEERDGDTRAKYYTNETPLHEVDETLQSGSFTGYVELSENVLSGDYYAVYYGGRRMAAAYIGNAEQLLTGDEAFERADDEVGIYEVIDVDIDVTDVPGTDTEAAETTGTDDESAENSAGATDDRQATTAETAAEPSADPTESAIESIDISGSESTADETASSPSITDITLGEPAESTLESESPTDDPEPAADDRPGITAATDVEPEPASSGITDAEATTDLENEQSTTEDDHADRDQTPSESGGEPDAAVTVREDEPTPSESDGTEFDAEPAVDDAQSATDIDTDGERGAIDAAAMDAAVDDVDEPATTSEGPDSSALDPATVEEAAAQLDQSNISWTEDDVESAAEDESADSERFEQEAQWRETRRIPSIDPDNTEAATRDGDVTGRGDTRSRSRDPQSSTTTAETADSDARDTPTTSSSTVPEPTNRTHQQASNSTDGTRSGPQRTDRAETSTDSSAAQPASDTASSDEYERKIATLTQKLETLVKKRDTLAATVEELEAERDRLRSENEELSTTVDRLQSRIEELQTELEEARAATPKSGANAPEARTSLPAQQALAETNLFVRYGSKSQPTLETAHDGEADRTEVASNLRLEYHTGFDASDVVVDGTPYEEFLTTTMEYRFVDWLTEMVLYEIRDTGNANGLGDLYDAIPRIDRAELDATISLADDDTEDVPERVTFDIVAFDKMGNPLVVVNLNDSREPATQDMLEEMEEAASAVKANYPDLAAATVVTSSYFEPGALEVADQATSSGLLSRSSKLSYVNLSRKQGYHLCLVESRSEGFHMNVPEL
ncbi:DUF7527 domain-containing protein [Natronorubrum aibiense]|uniref:Transcriptional regulator n=1 Tax=Natronorubrum aibiense TaxID=348826 RepID=A0A5P9P551_9EURY|nr:transcriptional regulator [Natronorubrum aibiense]QFU83196.1 transcriptional regulator [Natronorubrum aibiense]